MEKYTTFLYEKDSRGVGKIVFNRPQVRNAFDEIMIAELTDFFQSIPEDLKVILISGNGKSFCAGADINWMKKMKNYTEQENLADSLKLYDMLQTINNCPIPVVAKIHGAALGGGAGLLCVCDYVIAEKKTKIGFTEVRLGLVPAVISPFVTCKIGESWARACMLSGEILSTHRAFHTGIIHDTAPAEELDEKVEQTLNNILQSGPQAVRECKKMLGFMLRQHISHYRVEPSFPCNTIAKVRIGEEAQEGMGALLEKRNPGWISE